MKANPEDKETKPHKYLVDLMQESVEKQTILRGADSRKLAKEIIYSFYDRVTSDPSICKAQVPNTPKCPGINCPFNPIHQPYLKPRDRHTYPSYIEVEPERS